MFGYIRIYEPEAQNEGLQEDIKHITADCVRN